jgi:hypothetical protein
MESLFLQRRGHVRVNNVTQWCQQLQILRSGETGVDWWDRTAGGGLPTAEWPVSVSSRSCQGNRLTSHSQTKRSQEPDPRRLQMQPCNAGVGPLRAEGGVRNSMEHSPRQAGSRSAGVECLQIYGNLGLLSCSPQMHILSQMNDVHNHSPNLRYILILSSHLSPGLQSGLFLSGFPTCWQF